MAWISAARTCDFFLVAPSSCSQDARFPLQTHTAGTDQSLRGHGKDIHDIAVHPSRPHLVLTASKDESVRLWSLAGACCVAVFKGEGAHTHEVISLVGRGRAGRGWLEKVGAAVTREGRAVAIIRSAVKVFTYSTGF
jgi:WD40 repeat protein